MRFHASENHINGTWVPSAGRPYPVVNPATEEVIGHALESDVSAVDAAVGAARTAFDSGTWPRLSLAERIEALRRVFALIAERSEEFAQAHTAQMGAPISFSRMLTLGGSRLFEAHARAAEGIDLEYLVTDPVGTSLVQRAPVGVVGVILPWNGPLSALVSHAMPALVVGCTVVVKPAPETPLEAGMLAELFAEAGLPPGIINVVTGGAAVGESLVGHPGVDMISFTGSSSAGSRVGQLAGSLFKRTNLELGGKSAGIVLDDADLVTTASALAAGNFGNSGQVCVAISRVLVPDSLHDEFVELLKVDAAERVVGDPLDDDTQMGPLATSRQRDRVLAYIDAAVEEGATVALGGGAPESLDQGCFVAPTILTGVRNSMAVAQEEVFGPVLSVLRYADEADAVSIANDSPYGLHGAVFSRDPARALRVAQAIDTGSVAINGTGLTPSTPYGGRKKSGVGREHGREGILGFLQVTSFVIPDDLARELTSRGVATI